MKTWLSVVVLVAVLTPTAAQAQSVEESERLGWLQLAYQGEGLIADRPEHWPRMTQLAHEHGFMWDLSLDQVNYAVYAANDLKRIGGRLVNAQGADWCRTADTKARALDRMQRAFAGLSFIFGLSAAYASSTALVLPVVGIPLAGVLYVGTGVTAISAAAAGWLAADYRSQRQQFNCAKGDDSWFQPVKPQRSAALQPELSRRLLFQF